MPERSIEKSLQYLKRAKKLIPCQTQTLAKGPTQWVQGVAPNYLHRGKGAYVWDVDENRYIDYAMALGPMVLGYCNPVVNRAVKEQLDRGSTFTLMHPLEVEVAEMLTRILPWADMVRYGKNGSDATSVALRLARAYTGRDKIACCGYHGFQDWYIGTTERNRGIPQATSSLSLKFEYNDLDSLTDLFTSNREEIAAVIMEVVAMTPPEPGFLEAVRSLTHKHGAVLIFDELFTGFRFALGGAAEYFGVEPDLACYGKAICNGFPLSVLAGRGEIMREFEDRGDKLGVFFSFTFGGEALSLAAAKATLSEMEDKQVIDFIWEQGRKLMNSIDDLAKKNGITEFISTRGYPPKNFLLATDPEQRFSPLQLKSLFQQECIKRGVLFIGYHAMSYSHNDKIIAETLRAYDGAMKILKSALVEGDLERYMEGPYVTQVFKNVGDRWGYEKQPMEK